MLLKAKSLSLPRVVIGALLALVVAAFIARALGGLDANVFPPAAMLATLAVLVGTSLAVSWLLGLGFSSGPSLESAAITGLILWFLYWPSLEPATLLWFAGIAALAQASKYLIAWRGRHVVNPVAAGVLLSVGLGALFGAEAVPFASWWVASEALFWPVLVAGIVVVSRSGRTMISWCFVVSALTYAVLSLIDINETFGIPITVFEATSLALYAMPIVFFATFMLTEPITMPSRRGWQVAAALVAAAISTGGLLSTSLNIVVPSHFQDASYEWALVATGLIALLSRQRSAIVTLRERVNIDGDAVEYRWVTKRPLQFRAGQYVEIDLAHVRSDTRGRRRAFSPISTSGEPLRIATRHPEPASTYKQVLAGLQPGDRARVTSVHGDFVWPRRGPIVLIGAGIGVTPFLSQLAAEPDRDVVVVVGVRPEGQPYLDELRVLAPRLIELPVDEVTLENLSAQIDDLKSRQAFISGRPDFVLELRVHLYRKVRKVHTDYFWGS